MAEKALKRRQKAEEITEEKVIDLFDLPTRRKHFQEDIKELSEFVTKYLIEGAKEKTEGISFFSYFFANIPSTRHEAHWQLQSFVLLEILQELKKLSRNMESEK